MPVSGVQVPPEVKEIAEAQKKGKTYQYVVFELQSVKTDDGKEINTWVIKSSVQRIEQDKRVRLKEAQFKKLYEEFIEKELTADAVVFALYDFENLELDSGEAHKLNRVAYQWCPDNLQPKKKMCFASSVEVLKKAVADNTLLICGNEKDEVSFKTVLGKPKK